MKISKKQQAKWDRQNRMVSDGHAVNNQETAEERALWEKQEAAFERLKQNPELLKTLIRMKGK